MNRILKFNLLLLGMVSIILFPYVAESSSLILDEINITAIQDMQLRKDKNTYFMDVICVVRNSSKSILKLEKARFDLGFALKDAEDISIGSVFKDEVILENKADSPSMETKVQLVTNLGDDIQKLHLSMISSEDMSSLMMEPKPKLNFHIRGDFGLGIGLKQRWVYLQGVTIDWILTVDIPRDVFVKTYKTIERVAKGGKIDDYSKSDALFDEEDEFFKENTDNRRR